MYNVSWRLSDADETLAATLAVHAGLRPLTARVLVSRGLTDPEGIARFLAPRLGDLRRPDGIADLDRALDRLVAAIRNHEPLGVFGDYDVDGVTTAAVLTVGLRAFGAEVTPRVARRISGYGLPTEVVDELAMAGCRVIVTGDCGTSDVPALTRARELGIDVIVIDHHQVPTGERLAYALINPHQSGDEFAFKGLASCGLAFYLMAALKSRLGVSGFDPRDLLDLVALGTIADLVPLRDENRILVTAGLRVLAARKRPGVRALMELAHVSDPIVTTDDVSFRLTPRLNAAGRLGDAQLALDLLLADEKSAGPLAAALDDVNRERQRIQERVWTEVIAAAADFADAPAIVVGREGWHHGVVGIVAARLVDRFGKPAIVIGFDGEDGRGSARTVAGVDLFAALGACQEHLTRFGGHAAAAGLSLTPPSLDDFRIAFVAEVARRRSTTDRPAVMVDGVLDLAEVSLALVEELARLSPFGMGNPEPLWAFPRVVATETRVVGQSHLQLTVSRDGAQGDAIGFGMGALDPGRGAEVDLVAIADLDTFRGNRRARLRVKHLIRNPDAEL